MTYGVGLRSGGMLVWITGMTLLITGMIGCGSGREPMSILGDPSQSLGGSPGAAGPGLALPINPTANLYGSGSAFSPYTASNPFIGLQSQNYLSTTSINAPGAGVVIDITNQSVSIYHNAHVISKVTGITTNIQVGAYVTQGQSVGFALPSTTFFQTAGQYPTLKFYVYADGMPVCPLTYLNAAGRAQLVTAYSVTSFTNDPCQ